MKVLNCTLENFASYKSLHFNFQDQGLALIQGANGSGKSTLCDAIPWVLFGRTAKDGNVDEVLSWNAERPTSGTLTLENLQVTRIRGSKPKDNDLYFSIQNGPIQRGKDLNDTQKLINHHLNIDVDLYLSGAYFHEFSKIAQFFTAKAKDRRQICEQLVDLSLPKKLQEALKLDQKAAKDALLLAQRSTESLSARLQHLGKNKADAEQRLKNFDEDKDSALKQILAKMEAFEAQRARVTSDLTTRGLLFGKDLAALGHQTNGPCPHCGAKPNDTVSAVLSEKLKQVQKELKRWETDVNPHLALYEREEARENTFQEQLDEINQDLALRQKQFATASLLEAEHQQTLADLELMTEVVEVLRGELVKDTINALQDQTNLYLSNHFDAEISVAFNALGDSVDVSVSKDGNRCVYNQLSKGQRQLLKMCFGISVMQRVANQHGIQFDQIFFDEFADGCSDETKVKAHGLLETLSLSYNSVFVIDHSSALQNLFDKRFLVTLTNGNSEINEA